MKHKFFSIFNLLTLFLLINNGCSSQPATVATSADGVEISFSNTGTGEPAILLVHGWTNNKTIWDQQVPVLAKKYQVIAVDLAGHGESGNDRKEWKMSSFGEDIAAVVKILKLKKVILVGFSMGGPAILEANKIIPDKVAGLIFADAITNPEQQIPPPMIHMFDSLMMDLIQNPTAEKGVALGFVVNNPEESMEKVKVMLDRDQTGWNDMLLENFRWENEDCIPALKEVKVPLVSINPMHNMADIMVFNKYVPSFEARYLGGTGHVMMWDVTEDFNRTLEESIQVILSYQ